MIEVITLIDGRRALVGGQVKIGDAYVFFGELSKAWMLGGAPVNGVVGCSIDTHRELIMIINDRGN